MEANELQRVVAFQIQFDKPIASQIKIAEWNPNKDLLAMVIEDSKLLLHRLNWQRLWTTSLVGLEDGTISLHDVENGKLLRSMKFHCVSVVCLNWEEDRKETMDGGGCNSTYEDRTARFFPPAPTVPQIPGLVQRDSSSSMDENDDTFLKLFDSSHQQFDILCSGDKDGNIYFNIFGVFPIGKVNILDIAFRKPLVGNHASYKLMDASICKMALSSDICHIMVLCSGVRAEIGSEASNNMQGFHSLALDTSVFQKRKNELHQVAKQASNVENLIEVIRKSIGVMSKQWSDAMLIYHEKFNVLSTLIVDNGLDSSPQEELLSLLGGARTSPPVHQFLVNSLGERGLKLVAKAISGAGKELQKIVLDHLQPAAEMIGFRMGELRGLSKWCARFRGIGLEENLIDNATEKAGMFLVQIERFIRILSSVVQQFLYDQDPIGALLQDSKFHNIEVDSLRETMQRVAELAYFGGFSDSEYLKRTLATEFQQLEPCLKEALEMPSTMVSRCIRCKDMLPLFPVSPTLHLKSFPASLSYYQEEQLVLLLNGVAMASEDSGNACMMIAQTADLTFVPVTGSSTLLSWNLLKLQDCVTYLQLENEKVREIPHSGCSIGG